MGLVVYDTFTEASGTPALSAHTPDVGGTWTAQSSLSAGTAEVTIDSSTDVIYPVCNSGANKIYYNATAPANNQQEIRLYANRKGNYNTGQSTRFYCRCSSGASPNAIMAQVYNGYVGKTTVQVYKFVNGSPSAFGGTGAVDFTMTQNTEYLISLIVNGTNAILRTSTDDGASWTEQINATDASAPTQTGFFAIGMTDTNLGVGSSIVTTALWGLDSTRPAVPKVARQAVTRAATR